VFPFSESVTARSKASQGGTSHINATLDLFRAIVVFRGQSITWLRYLTMPCTAKNNRCALYRSKSTIEINAFCPNIELTCSLLCNKGSVLSITGATSSSLNSFKRQEHCPSCKTVILFCQITCIYPFQVRHFGMDCQIQAPLDGFELTIHGTGYPHPGGYDVLAN